MKRIKKYLQKAWAVMNRPVFVLAPSSFDVLGMNSEPTEEDKNAARALELPIVLVVAGVILAAVLVIVTGYNGPA